MDTIVLGQLMEAKVKYENDKIKELGKEIGKLYTNNGLPVSMALNRLQINNEQKLVILDCVGQWLIEHKRNSGATDKAIQRQREINKRNLVDFIKKGEVNLY